MKFLLKKRGALLFATCIVALLYWQWLPEPLFKDPYATVMFDVQANLLGGQIADDGQWRFPAIDSVPHKLKESIILFEDAYFYYHPGFNPVSLVRAALQNLKAGRVLSGGSTLTMQTIRLARKGKPRTFGEKCIELLLAVRLELSYTKEEILALYLSHAPFGGNVVGLQAATWRYFARNPDQLSWAEAALLAVLPNQPGLLFPGSQQEALRLKRNTLLGKLYQNQTFDSLTYSLALLEPLPEKPIPLPMLAPHLLQRAVKEGWKGRKIMATLDADLQLQASRLMRQHAGRFQANEVHHAAVLVLDIRQGKVLAYLGNMPGTQADGYQVDVITAPRSTGSILKPFLFASMLDEGLILPNTLVADIPTFIQGFAPKNYDQSYDGAVKARLALARSLNVPAVRLLQDYSVEKFLHKLRGLGLSTLGQPAGHYGLSLILGGAEATLWDLCKAYAGMARVLLHFHELNPYPYRKGEYMPPHFTLQAGDELPLQGTEPSSLLSAAAIWSTFEAMLEVYRPGANAQWELFDTGRKVAWKTGTSYGNRDAWAIGLTPDHVVGVWVGNASGEGRPELTGLNMAAPLLFDVFDLLPLPAHWFELPYDELLRVSVCRESGHLASRYCPVTDSVWVPVAGQHTEACPYHKVVHVDPQKAYQVHSECMSVAAMVQDTFFVLPPAMEWYYRRKAPGYRTLPPFRPDCVQASLGNQGPVMQMIYPSGHSAIRVPIELSGELGKVVFQVAHVRPSARIFWYLNEDLLGTTQRFHELAAQPPPGKHLLTLVDEEGSVLYYRFEVVARPSTGL